MSRSALVFLALAFGVFLLEPAFSAELRINTEHQLAGKDSQSGATFSATERGDVVEIRIDLATRKTIVARVDYEHLSLVVRSVRTGTNSPAAVTARDLGLVQTLAYSLEDAPFRVGDALSSVLSFVSEAPVGHVIEIDTGAKAKGSESALKAVASLCGVSSATGRWDVGKKDFRKQVSGLGCYTTGNECLGRCGAGCSYNPKNPTAVQRITKQCLDHDLCTRDTGDILGQCKDEWATAADGFLFGKDCGSLTGTWADNAGATWTLSQGPLEGLSGQVRINVPACPVYQVSDGEHEGKKFDMTITQSSPDCCPSVAIRGVIQRSCNNAAVNWTNSCGFNGTLSFTRGSAKGSGDVQMSGR